MSLVAWKVINAVYLTGAITVKRLESRYGPGHQWMQVVQAGYASRTETVYGTVLTLSPAAYDELYGRYREWVTPEMQGDETGVSARASAILNSGNPLARPPAPRYLRGPNAITDRAYQTDALLALSREGYQIAEHTLKQRGGLNSHTETSRTNTDQIVHSLLRVPTVDAERLSRVWGQPVCTLREFKSLSTGARSEHRLGYPQLYATVSGGGVTPRRVRDLLRVLDYAINEWRSPLLIAVPDLEPFRPIQRYLLTQVEALRKECALSSEDVPQILRLIHQPLPRTCRSS